MPLLFLRGLFGGGEPPLPLLPVAAASSVSCSHLTLASVPMTESLTLPDVGCAGPGCHHPRRLLVLVALHGRVALVGCRWQVQLHVALAGRCGRRAVQAVPEALGAHAHAHIVRCLAAADAVLEPAEAQPFGQAGARAPVEACRQHRQQAAPRKLKVVQRHAALADTAFP